MLPIIYRVYWVCDKLTLNTILLTLFLDIQKVYDSVWCNGLWYKLWDMGVKGRRMCHVVKKLYESSRSVVYLEGEKLDLF